MIQLPIVKPLHETGNVVFAPFGNFSMCVCVMLPFWLCCSKGFTRIRLSNLTFGLSFKPFTGVQEKNGRLNFLTKKDIEKCD